MKKLFLLPAIAIALNAYAAEYFVDPATGNDSNAGDASAPFKTIAAAIKAASPSGGDTITLKGGTYRERFELGANITATSENPYIIQGAEGERVIVTGFEPITGWKDAGNGIYTADVPEFINGLFVGVAPQPLARWPHEVGKWLPFGEPDDKAMTVTAEGLDKCPDIVGIATEPRSLQTFAYVARPAVYATRSVKTLDPQSGKVTIGDEKWWGNYTGKGDFLTLQNHPLLVKEAGDWAVAAKDDTAKDSTVYFKPKSPKDLENTYYRTRNSLIVLRGSSGVVIRNLEVSGAGRMGVEIATASKDSTLEGCTVHNCFGMGISVRQSNNITLRSNISLANEDGGITVASTDTALVEGNEVCFSMIDGLRVVGNASGRPGTEPDSVNVTLRRNYIHHHYYMSHPDNIQTFAGVKELKIEDNLLLFGGQNTMTEQTNDSEMRGNVSMFTSAYITIFGNKTSHRWLVEGNTFGYGGWGSFLLTDSEGNKFFDNVFIGTGLHVPPGTQSDHNVFITRRYASAILLTDPKGQTRHVDMALASEASETDANSQAFEDMPFKNLPQGHSIYERFDDPERLATTTFLPLRKRGGNAPFGRVVDFIEGDNVEINGDGVMRKVTAVENGGIKFTPALPQSPFRDAFVLNWSESTSTQLDQTLEDSDPIMKAARDGKRAGSALDIAAYQRGELLETGKRTLPAIPDDLKAAWPNPNYYVPPMHGR